MSRPTKTFLAGTATACSKWQGGSGREYSAVAESKDAFRLDDTSIYILVDHEAAGWVGSARDLIEDQSSRARFRHAMRRASNVLRVQGPSDDVERMCLMFDIEGGRQVARRNAA